MKNTQLYYLLIMLGSLFFPLILSFDKKLNFKQYFKVLRISIPIVAICFILWDTIFTQLGIWGFNGKYHLDIMIFNLPIEEIIFFLVVPYACLFIYENIKRYFKINFGEKSHIIYLVLGILTALFSALYFVKIYTCTTLFFNALLFLFLYLKKPVYAGNLIVAYLISLLPFMIVNGLLTGAYSPEPVVWYNNYENLGIRFITIPIEDFSFSFSLVSLNIICYEYLKSKLNRTH